MIQPLDKSLISQGCQSGSIGQSGPAGQEGPSSGQSGHFGHFGRVDQSGHFRRLLQSIQSQADIMIFQCGL